jgi:hypothetical protein
MRAPTRRELIRAGAAAVPAGLVLEQAAALAADGRSDADRLAGLLALEELAAAVYSKALASASLTPAGHALLSQVRAQELEHAAALLAELKLIAPTGFRRSRRPRSATDIDRALAAAGVDAQLDHQRDQRDWLRVLEHLENALEGAYYKALLRLKAPDVATLTARILANEAQHNTLLTELRHPGRWILAVPVAIVQGDAQSR